MRYELLEPNADPNASIDLLVRVFSPLYTESWTREKAPARGISFDLNVGAFVNLWLSKALRIFIAYNDSNQPAGYLLGMLYRPLTHNVNVFQIEDWYMKDGHNTRELFEHVYSVMPYMGVDELQIQHRNDEYFTPVNDKWRKADELVTARFVRI